MTDNLGTVYTFYSYKGGVGRSMALANVAAMLGKWGRKVLIVDWDLEAPGIEKYFTKRKITFSSDPNSKEGIVDWVNGYISSEPISWRDCVIRASSPEFKTDISIITAGQRNENYVKKLQNIVWEEVFSEYDFGNYLEEVRNEWIEDYDFILLDSRTGITDIGGVCTIHLPDVLVLMFTTNEQSLGGVCEVIKLARESRRNLPFDRSYLFALPVPSRDESRTEYEAAQQWKVEFSNRLDRMYRDWIPKDVNSSEILDLLRIPYIPYWSFGEPLPVIEEGTSDPTSLGFSLEILSRLISTNLDWKNAIDGTGVISKIKTIEKTSELDDDMTKINTISVEKYLEERLDSQQAWYSKKSAENQRNYKTIITTQLISSLLIPLIAANSGLLNNHLVSDLIVSFLGIIIASCTGVLFLNRFQENWILYRDTSEALKREKFLFMTGSSPYQYADNRFNLFVGRVETILSEDIQSWKVVGQENSNMDG